MGSPERHDAACYVNNWRPSLAPRDAIDYAFIR